jgi:hypothetical protein
MKECVNKEKGAGRIETGLGKDAIR